MCEWNPATGQPTLSTEEPHAPAEYSVNTPDGTIHLCAECAALPRWGRAKRRSLPAAGR